MSGVVAGHVGVRQGEEVAAERDAATPARGCVVADDRSEERQPADGDADAEELVGDGPGRGEEFRPDGRLLGEGDLRGGIGDLTRQR